MEMGSQRRSSVWGVSGRLDNKKAGTLPRFFVVPICARKSAKIFANLFNIRNIYSKGKKVICWHFMGMEVTLPFQYTTPFPRLAIGVWLESLVRKWLGTWLGRTSQPDISPAPQGDTAQNILFPLHSHHMSSLAPQARINLRLSLSPFFGGEPHFPLLVRNRLGKRKSAYG